MEKIKNWLQSPQKDFPAGVQLLSEVSKNKHLVKMIAKKIDQQRYQNKLIYELERLSKTSVAPIQKKPIKKERPAPKPLVAETKLSDELAKLPERFSPAQYKLLPQEIKILEATFKDTFKKRAFLRNRLELLPSDDDRKEAAKTILQMTELITGILADINYFKEHGILPSSTSSSDELSDDQLVLKEQLRLCRSRISKAQKKSSLTEKQSAKLQSDIELKSSLERKIESLAIQTN
jgi:hypothetical protein